MRDILFRGRRTNNGDFVCGGYAYDTAWKKHFITHNTMWGSVVLCEVDGNTIGQYTGIDDKHDVHIYEGDIVKMKIETGPNAGFEWPNMTVAFADGAFSLMKRNGYVHCALGGLAPTITLEVVGNIHEQDEGAVL